jgi:hypothetical protein
MNRFKPSVLALGLASLGLSACVGAPVSSPTVLPSTSAAPPTEAPASAAPSAAASVAPAPGPAIETTTLRGKVYDESLGAVPDGSKVSVRSLDTTRPFETTVETRGGTYVVNGAPVGAALEISAYREDWTRRTRVEVLRTNLTNLERRNQFNFGGPRDDNDPAGPSYFISDYPEIERVEPSDDASSQSSARMTFKLVMSEALDVTNQRRLASAFMIVPNNEESLADDAALPEDTATASVELTGLRAGADPLTTSAYRYRQNSGFLNGAQLSIFKWDADNRTATFTLEAPVKTGNDDEGEYAFLLVQQDEDVIQDRQGKPLGMNEAGEFGRTLRNDVIHNAIREAELSLATNQTDDVEARWNDTHLSFTTFQVLQDNEAPKLVSVTARRNYADESDLATDRIELTFSEPMVAYPRLSGSQLLSLNNYVITAAATQAEVDARTLSDDGTAADISIGAEATTAREAFGGATGGVIGSNASTTNGNYSIALSVKDPRVVVLSLPAGALPLEADFIKVLVGTDANAPGAARKSVTDPAGNAIDVNGRSASGAIL